MQKHVTVVSESHDLASTAKEVSKSEGIKHAIPPNGEGSTTTILFFKPPIVVSETVDPLHPTLQGRQVPRGCRGVGEFHRGDKKGVATTAGWVG